MKLYGQAIVILLSMLMVCATACGGGSNAAPTPTPTPELAMLPPSFGYLPEGWQLIFEIDYGQYPVEGAPKTGSIQYNNEDGTAIVIIEYGELPVWASEKEYDAQEFLEEYLSRECESCQIPEPDEIGTMTFCGRPAAYARLSLPEENTFCIRIISINDSAMIEGAGIWLVADKENEVMSIISNISY
jgi:hypothetical protein